MLLQALMSSTAIFLLSCVWDFDLNAIVLKLSFAKIFLLNLGSQVFEHSNMANKTDGESVKLPPLRVCHKTLI